MKRGTRYIATAQRVTQTSPQSGPSDTLPSWAYTCPELGRTCARPGAYAAFDLPSLYGSRLHFPDGRVLPASASAPVLHAWNSPGGSVSDAAELAHSAREPFDIKLLPVLRDKLEAGTLTLADKGDLESAVSFLQRAASPEGSAV